MSISLTLNGEKHIHDGDNTIGGLLQKIGANPARVAVMHNGSVIKGESRDDVNLSDNDVVEVLIFAGGG